MKLISVVTPCYNEEENIVDLYKQVKSIFETLPQYRYEHIFVDNASTDKTINLLKKLALQDKNIKIIINARNFGQMRSSFHALLQAKGDAVISIVADLQEPPELIPEFIQKWEAGYKIIVGVKPTTQETFLMANIRRAYYKFVSKIADIKLIKNFTGFGLYDQSIIEIFRNIQDPNPYLRGLISDIGFPITEVPFHQPIRQKGISKYNFYKLYDLAMLGITNHSKLPIRIATIAGFSLSCFCLLGAFIFLILKLMFWNHFSVGIALLLIAMFFFASVQLFFIGLVGEYLLSIHAQVLNRPLVIEQERINFE